MSGQFSERVNIIINLAREEAARLKHDYIGTEHLLLGIVKEGTGSAVQVLANLEIDIDEIARRLEESVSDGGTMVMPETTLPMTPRAKKTLERAKIEAHNSNAAQT